MYIYIYICIMPGRYVLRLLSICFDHFVIDLIYSIS